MQASPGIYFMCDPEFKVAFLIWRKHKRLPKLAPCGRVFGMRETIRAANKREEQNRNLAFSTHVFVSTFNKNPVWPPEAIL